MPNQNISFETFIQIENRKSIKSKIENQIENSFKIETFKTFQILSMLAVK